jgi:flagellar motor component MotA
MQLIGFAMLAFVVWYGFVDRASDKIISAFDLHALVMVLVGSASAVVVSSSAATTLRTLTLLGELIPGVRLFANRTRQMEEERLELSRLWASGARGQAVALGERSTHPATKKLLELLVSRSPDASAAKVYLELKHEELARWQPAVHNWEMLSKLGPSFGMVGTITGMIRMFQNMSSDNLNIGAAMSLALLATLYGVAFGAGVAGPIGKFLAGLLDERLGVLERCELSANELSSRGG